MTAPVRATGRAGWVLLFAFAGAMVLLVIVGAAAMAKSARLAHARRYDALTGLANRALFLDHLQFAVDKRRPLAMLFIDLDGFKPVNDRFGHAAGDALLTEVAARLTKVVRDQDLVGRFGGDEFVVLCPDSAGSRDAAAVADRIQQAVCTSFVVDGHDIGVGASIGIALHDSGVSPAKDIVHRADLAMYRAKKMGGGRTELYTEALSTDVLIS